MKIPFFYFRREATPGGDKSAWEIGIRFSFPWRDRKKVKEEFKASRDATESVKQWENQGNE